MTGANNPRTSNTFATSKARTRFVTLSEGGRLEIARWNVSILVFHSRPKVLVQPFESEIGSTSSESRRSGGMA